MARFLLPHLIALMITPSSKGDYIMSGKTDEIKGRVKEAAGAVTDNNRLRTEGQTDQAVGKAKQAVEKVADKTKEAIDKVTKR
jgi:uncharacterized protein YjbJ (UPF0337 family)